MRSFPDERLNLYTETCSDVNAWDMTNNDVEDWDAFLRIAMDKALDHGIDSVSVIDHVASAISLNDTPTLSSSTRIADLLLSHLEICEARQIPSDVLEFVNNTLVSTYPPEPRNKVTSMWLMRSLTRIIDACPQELYLNLFELIQEGLRIWIADEYEVFTAEEYSMDVSIAHFSCSAIDELLFRSYPSIKLSYWGFSLCLARSRRLKRCVL